MPNDDGLIADVRSRPSGALYNWNRPFNDQSVAYYKARHREDIELNRARRTRRAAEMRDVSSCRSRQLYESPAHAVLCDRDPEPLPVTGVFGENSTDHGR
jgi:hypothetical protein